MKNSIFDVLGFDLFSIGDGAGAKQDVTVAVGSCTPIRNQVKTALKPYGIVIHDLTCWGEKAELNTKGELVTKKTDDEDKLAEQHVAKITVNAEAAEWVEYLLLRTKRYRLLSDPVNPDNERWAIKWDAMPRAWHQPGCTPPPGKAQRQASGTAQQRPPRRSGDLFDKLLDW